MSRIRSAAIVGAIVTLTGCGGATAPSVDAAAEVGSDAAHDGTSADVASDAKSEVAAEVASDVSTDVPTDVSLDASPDASPEVSDGSVGDASAGDSTADVAPVEAGPPPTGITPTFTFESGPVRPIALSPDGTRLFVANTSNASLDVFTITTSGLAPAGSVYVGIDPVAVAARTSDEVWVVNQVSDSVSVVDVSATPPHVERTLLVGDEPSDIVFGGASGERAFITTAHRGQQRTDPSIAMVPGAGDPELTTAGVGRADVWVFDATALGTSVGGDPLSIVTLFGDTPRGLAVTPDGATVYVAIFKSGNQSVATNSLLPCAGFDSATKTTTCTVDGLTIPGAPPGPATNYAGVNAPAVSVLLHADSTGAFRDILDRDWTATIPFTLPDEDVFAIDAISLATTASYQHVGTTLFNLAVNPSSGHVYVSNTEARNDLRFEGPGTYAGTTLQGHLAEARITVLSPTDATPVNARHLNKHIDYATLPAPAGTAANSLSMPLGMAVTADGATLYVAAFGSSKVGVFTTSELEADTFDPTTESSRYITVTGGGPGGVVLDEARGRLYVSTRFDDGLSVVDLTTGAETSHVTLTNPEPASVTAGRSFLYDANKTSSNGEASCASCHMFGDDDHVVWDLGNPDNDAVVTPITVKLGFGAPSTINGGNGKSTLHPMKGPMATQTLRGTVNHGPMHWRGDRAVGYYGTDPNTGPPYDSELAFKNFVQAFNTLVGRSTQLDDADMQTFTNFGLNIVMPPNPVRALDNSLTTAQAAGQRYFMGCDGLDSSTGAAVTCVNGQPTGTGHLADGVAIASLGFTCQGCHRLDPSQGFFGTDGESSFESLPQTVKIPQLRNLYDKIGMFGAAATGGSNAGDNGPMGPQVRSIGFEHDGSVDTLFRFLQANVFNSTSGGKIGFANGDPQRRDVEQYLLAFDSDLAPIVGQQVTLRSDNAAAVGPRIDLLIARASSPFISKILGPNATECSLVARLSVGGASAVYRLQLDGTFLSPGGVTIADADLRAFSATEGQEITYTCLPPGW